MPKIIVIGAGPGGLVCTKEILERGITDVLCLEQSEKLGGVFSDTYDNLLLTSSAVFSMFSDYWVGDGNEHHFWTKKEALDYWTGYAEHFGVTNHIQFGTKVTDVLRLDNGGWELKLNSGSVMQCDHLVLAIGNNNICKYPDWAANLNKSTYSHAKDYKNALPFKGKRVLVVGGGESASDIAYEISSVADKCWVSLRESTGWVVPRKRGERAADISTHRGVWNLPREYGETLSKSVLDFERKSKDPVFQAVVELNSKVKAKKGIWGTYGTKTINLPKAMVQYDCKIVDEIVDVENGGSQLRTASRDVLQDVDFIIFCTGYSNQISFMPDELQACDPRSLYKHMFHPEIGNRLAWIGWARPNFGSQFPIMEMQSRLCSYIFSGDHSLPKGEDMKKTAKIDSEAYLQQFEGNTQDIRSLVDYFRYMDDLAGIIGCLPPLSNYLILRPHLWFHLVYGPTQSTQYRLRGPGNKVTLARKILKKIPVSKINHMVKAGIRGRMYFALNALLLNINNRQSKE